MSPGLGLDQVDDDDGTITREAARVAWPAASNGKLATPKPVKLCACGCGQPFEPSSNRQIYRPGCRKLGKPGPKTKRKTTLAATAPKPKAATATAPAAASPTELHSHDRPCIPIAALLVQELLTLPGVRHVEVHVGPIGPIEVRR